MRIVSLLSINFIIFDFCIYNIRCSCVNGIHITNYGDNKFKLNGGLSMSENTMAKCETCGQPLTANEGTCPNCSVANEQTFTLQQPAETKSPSFFSKIMLFVKSHKKISIASAVAAFVVALVIVLVVALVPTPTDNLLKAADTGELDGFGFLVYLEEAQDVYSSPRKISKLEKAVKKRADNVYEDFQQGKTPYITACSIIDSYALLPQADSVTDKYVDGLRQKLDMLNNSTLAYESALDLEDSGNIDGALLKYAEVVEDDKSYSDAQSRIDKLSNTFVENLQALDDKNDYRNIILQGFDLSKNLKINDSSRNQIFTLVEKAKAALKATAEKDLTIEVKEHDTGGTYTKAFTKRFELTSNNGIKATIYGGSAPEDKDYAFGIHISFFPEDYTFVDKTFIGSTQNNIEGDADIDTEYAGYNLYYEAGGKNAKYMASGTGGYFSWDEAKKLYDILDGSEQTYIKLYSSYGDDSFAFPLSEDFRKAILFLLDYNLALWGETPTVPAS